MPRALGDGSVFSGTAFTGGSYTLVVTYINMCNTGNESNTEA